MKTRRFENYPANKVRRVCWLKHGRRSPTPGPVCRAGRRLVGQSKREARETVRLIKRCNIIPWWSE